MGSSDVISKMYRISDSEFKELRNFVHENYGIFLRDEKKALVLSRFQRYMMENNFYSFKEYLDFLKKSENKEALTTLVNKITTNYTFFMRESEHFKYFRDVILPYLKEKNRNKDMRIWSAGCSSGEEPYTLAMIVDEFFHGQKENWDTKILATDISGEVLKTAIEGIYPLDKLSDLPNAWKVNYFKIYDKSNMVVSEKIREEVIFRSFNLMEKVFPFKKKFDVIFCRNVMIYFDEQTKNELVQRFFDNTNLGGYLFIGHSESINRSITKYKNVIPSLYRKE